MKKEKSETDESVGSRTVIKCERCLHAMEGDTCIGEYCTCNRFADISAYTSNGSRE